MVLDVQGMKCGGCSAAVKRILLAQPGVAGAAVNLLTETAVVQVAAVGGSPPAAAAAAAAGALTAKGFPSKLRAAEGGVEQDAASLSARKEEELRKRCVFVWVGVGGRSGGGGDGGGGDGEGGVHSI